MSPVLISAEVWKTPKFSGYDGDHFLAIPDGEDSDAESEASVEGSDASEVLMSDDISDYESDEEEHE
jgi:hypothetical protein